MQKGKKKTKTKTKILHQGIFPEHLLVTYVCEVKHEVAESDYKGMVFNSLIKIIVWEKNLLLENSLYVECPVPICLVLDQQEAAKA